MLDQTEKGETENGGPNIKFSNAPHVAAYHTAPEANKKWKYKKKIIHKRRRGKWGQKRRNLAEKKIEDRGWIRWKSDSCLFHTHDKAILWSWQQVPSYFLLSLFSSSSFNRRRRLICAWRVWLGPELKTSNHHYHNQCVVRGATVPEPPLQPRPAKTQIYNFMHFMYMYREEGNTVSQKWGRERRFKACGR